MPSTSSQKTLEQIEVIQYVVSPEVSKLIQSVMNKNPGDQIQFSAEKKTLSCGKRKTVSSLFTQQITYLMDCVVK